MPVIFKRYVNDPTTAEQELHARSGEQVTLVGEPFNSDPEEYSEPNMQRVRFADGYEADAFVDELHLDTDKG